MRNTVVGMISVLAVVSTSDCICSVFDGPRHTNGEYSAVCNSDLDCQSNFCCRENECPGGFCTSPCVTGFECSGHFQICVDLGPYSACMIGCSTDLVCPAGYRCRRLDASTTGQDICREP